MGLTIPFLICNTGFRPPTSPPGGRGDRFDKGKALTVDYSAKAINPLTLSAGPDRPIPARRSDSPRVREV